MCINIPVPSWNLTVPHTEMVPHNYRLWHHFHKLWLNVDNTPCLTLDNRPQPRIRQLQRPGRNLSAGTSQVGTGGLPVTVTPECYSAGTIDTIFGGFTITFLGAFPPSLLATASLSNARFSSSSALISDLAFYLDHGSNRVLAHIPAVCFRPLRMGYRFRMPQPVP